MNYSDELIVGTTLSSLWNTKTKKLYDPCYLKSIVRKLQTHSCKIIGEPLQGS